MGDHRVRLPSTFRYMHAPATIGAIGAAIGREDAARAFADRLVLSNGGALLVTGFRGVGKTTFVQVALAELEANRGRYETLVGPFRLVDVWINLAKPVTAAQLMHLLIRQLYLRLDSLNLLPRLDPGLRHDLHTSFMRTCFEISARSVATEEHGRDVSVGLGKAPLLGLEFLGKVAATAKSTKSDEDLLKYLPYDEKAAETDLLDFSRRLARPPDAPVIPWYRRRWWQRGEQRPPVKIKVVFVLDELDKLERFTDSTTGNGSPLDPLFEALKTVFTGTEFSYVFIAGKEAHDRWLRDVERGDSIYESVFGYDVYLPCLWTDQDNVIERCLFGGGPHVERAHDTELAMFRRYLSYHGRGIPRRIVRELNRHVRWEDGAPVLAFSSAQRRSMAVFAKVQDLLDDVTDILDATLAKADTPADDRRRLALYYTLDWVLRRDRRSFTFAELHGAAQELNLGGVSQMTQDVIKRIVDLLIKRGLIARVSSTIVETSRAAAEAADAYRVADWVLRALQPVLESAADSPLAPPPSEPADVAQIGRYRVMERIAQGGMATVYRVTGPFGGVFAAKLLRWDTADPSSDSRDRFQRETTILRRLEHPSIVRVHDHGVQGGQPYFIMDYVEGSTLQALLARIKRLDPATSAFVGSRLASIYAYIHTAGIVRNDIKPSNIMIDRGGRLVIIDFGISHLEGANSLTKTNAVIGTPRYMSPEQVKGERVDQRSDIFSLGALVYELVTGTPAFQGSGVHEELLKVVNEMPPPPSALAPVSPAFDTIVLRALAKAPHDRFGTMMEFAAALVSIHAGEVDLAPLAVSTAATDDPGPASTVLLRGEAKAARPTRPVRTTRADSTPPEPARPATAVMWRPEAAPVTGEPVVADLLVNPEAKLLRTTLEPYRVVSLAKGPIVIGRMSEADITIPHPTLSRYHAMLAFAGERLVVEDLSAAHGVLVNGQRVTRSPLSAGDVVSLGSVTLQVVFTPLLELPPETAGSPTHTQPS